MAGNPVTIVVEVQEDHLDSARASGMALDSEEALKAHLEKYVTSVTSITGT